MVSLQNGNFCFTFGRKLSTSEEWQLLPILPQNTLGVTPANIPKNAIIEKSFHMEKIVQSIASSIKTHKGAGIFIDYGYFTTRGNSNRTNATKTANINSDMLLNPDSPLRAFNSSLQAVKNHHRQHIFKDVACELPFSGLFSKKNQPKGQRPAVITAGVGNLARASNGFIETSTIKSEIMPSRNQPSCKNLWYDGRRSR